MDAGWAVKSRVWDLQCWCLTLWYVSILYKGLLKVHFQKILELFMFGSQFSLVMGPPSGPAPASSCILLCCFRIYWILWEDSTIRFGAGLPGSGEIITYVDQEFSDIGAVSVDSVNEYPGYWEFLPFSGRYSDYWTQLGILITDPCWDCNSSSNQPRE